MRINVRLFATLKDKAQAGQLVLELGDMGATVKDLLAEIAAQKPSLEPSMRSVLVAVNHEYAFPEQVIRPDDEIALFPPVSGG
jgi:molybdopterin converting factor subunit 1